ncbi:hypothetical protein [Aquamicrobium soli]|jgi:hypothetical protein|uniref:Uncharacterized protein n=1 Tax=Aquamicrobium soli TaxID=1811518 RepID=A0ABV7KFY0_9HYPH
MNTIVIGMAALAILTAPAFAEMRYDRKLEQAAMEIVAGKIGDLRGGFIYTQKVQLVVRQDQARSPDAEMPTVNADNAANTGLPPSSVPRL